MNIWIILVLVTLILLAIFWNSKNAVWGGLTLGVMIGVFWNIITWFTGRDFSGYAVIKIATIGTLLGFASELIGIMGDYLKKRFSK